MSYPIVPTEDTITQWTESELRANVGLFFLNPVGVLSPKLREMMYSVRRIHDGNEAEVTEPEARDLYENLGLTTMPIDSREDVMSAIRDFYAGNL